VVSRPVGTSIFISSKLLLFSSEWGGQADSRTFGVSYHSSSSNAAGKLLSGLLGPLCGANLPAGVLRENGKFHEYLPKPLFSIPSQAPAVIFEKSYEFGYGVPYIHYHVPEYMSLSP
jgi:hypothetical protein